MSGCEYGCKCQGMGDSGCNRTRGLECCLEGEYVMSEGVGALHELMQEDENKGKE